MHLQGFAVLSSGLVTLFSLASGAPAFAQARGQSEGQPSLIAQFGNWGVYSGVSKGQKVCFALAQPASSETKPANRPRDPAYLIVSTRPADNIKHELSVIIGYPFKANSEATLQISGAGKFPMQTQSDNAWIKNAAEEPQVMEAMRKGADVVVQGVSGRGTQTTDRFSLKGLSQALDRVAQECR